MSVHKRLSYPQQGSPQANIKAEWVGVVWVESVTTSMDSLPTSNNEGRGGCSAEGARGEHTTEDHLMRD